MQYIIKDWANNSCFNGQLFDSFDAAEEFLSLQLGDEYESDRGEYEIESVIYIKERCYLHLKHPNLMR